MVKIRYINYHQNKYTSFYNFQLNFILNILKSMNKFEILSSEEFNYPVEERLELFIKYELETDLNNTIYIFNSLDYYFFTVNITDDNKELFYKFINSIKYIFFHYEVYTSNNLDQIGYMDYEKSIISNGLIKEDRKRFIIHIYQNAHKVILQSYKNIEYLKQYYINNIIYFPCLGYSKVNNFIPLQQKNKEVDLLFYGTRDENTPHRNNMIEKLIKYTDQNNINFVYDKFLYRDDKHKFLAKSKIIIHLPIKLESRKAPAWCKIMELMCKKIFFIIEENDEINKSGLQDIIVFYKHNDFTDLTNKVDYYLNNPLQINNIVTRCYELVKTKYDMDEFIKNLIN